MPYTPDYRIATSSYSQSFRAIVATLQRWPPLADAIKTWLTWDGEDNSHAEPVEAQCPAIRLTPQPGQANWATVGQHKAPFLIQVEIFTSGNRIDTALDLWAAIAGGSLDPGSVTDENKLGRIGSALYPADGQNTLSSTLAKCGSDDGYSVAQTGIGPVGKPDNTVLRVSGMIRIGLYVQTAT